MRDIARQHIGDRLDPAMGMPWKTLHGFRRIIVTKIVEQQERVQHARVVKPEGTVQMNPRALNCWLRKGFGFNRTERHFYSFQNKLAER